MLSEGQGQAWSKRGLGARGAWEQESEGPGRNGSSRREEGIDRAEVLGLPCINPGEKKGLPNSPAP